MEVVHRCRLPEEIRNGRFIYSIFDNIYFAGIEQDSCVYDADTDAHYYIIDTGMRIEGHFRCVHLGDAVVRFNSHHAGEITMYRRYNSWNSVFRIELVAPFDHDREEVWYAASSKSDPCIHLYTRNGDILRVIVTASIA